MNDKELHHRIKKNQGMARPTPWARIVNYGTLEGSEHPDPVAKPLSPTPDPPALMNPSSPRKTGRWSVWQRQIRYLYVRLLRLQSTPHALARGLAVGTFAGMFPFFGLQTAIALVLAIPLRGNKLVAAAATWVSNPFTYVPIFWFNYKLGQLVLNTEGPAFADLNWRSGEILQYTSSAAIALVLGSAISGFVVGLSAYIFGLKGFIWLQTRRGKASKLTK